MTDELATRTVVEIEPDVLQALDWFFGASQLLANLGEPSGLAQIGEDA
jgi:hypothetical protein